MIDFMESALPIRCAECGREWVDPQQKWRSYIDDDGNAIPFCPECAEREFENEEDE